MTTPKAISSSVARNPVFTPSLSAKCLGELTAPRTLVAGGTLGAMMLAGASLPVSIIAGGVALGSQKLFTKVVSGGDVLRPVVFVAADHLAEPQIQGGLPTLTIPPVLEALNAMQTEDSVLAKKCLQSILNYENYFNVLGVSNGILVADLIKTIRRLRPGQQIALPFSWMNIKSGGHIIIGSIERKKNRNFIVRVHNGGDGLLGSHHWKKDAETGCRLYQTTLEIDDVSKARIAPFIKQITSLHAFRLSHDSAAVYQSLLLLDGRILPPNSDQRFWSREQRGQSCSGYSVKCFLRTLLMPQSFQEFERHFLSQSAARLKTGIETGWFWEATSEHRSTYAEIRSKLLRLGEDSQDLIENVKTTRLAQISLNIGKSFWHLFFQKAGERVYFDDSIRIINLRQFHKLNMAFRKVIPVADKIEAAKVAEAQGFDSAQWQSKAGDRARKLLRNYSRLSRAYAQFSKEFRQLRTSLDRSEISREDLSKLNRYAALILDQTCHGPLDSQWKQTTGLFFGALFPYIKYRITDSGAQQLLQAVVCLKQNKMREARVILEQVYARVEALSHVSPELAEQYEYVMIDIFRGRAPKTLEEMELHAAVGVILAEVRVKLSIHIQHVKFGKERVPHLTASPNLDYCLSEYLVFRLDQEFPESPWKTSIFDHYLQSQRPINSHPKLSSLYIKQEERSRLARMLAEPAWMESV